MSSTRNAKKQKVDHATQCVDANVNIIVSDVAFHIPKTCLSKFPDSFFGTALEWNKKNNNNNPNQLVIDDRNAELFYHVAEYLRHGCLPRDKKGDCLIDRKLLPEFLMEADYFVLPELKREINDLMTFDTPAVNNAKKFIAMSESICKNDNKFGEDVSVAPNKYDKDVMKHLAVLVQNAYRYSNFGHSSILSSNSSTSSIASGQNLTQTLITIESTFNETYRLHELTKNEVIFAILSAANNIVDINITGEAIYQTISKIAYEQIGIIQSFHEIVFEQFSMCSKHEQKIIFNNPNKTDKVVVAKFIVCVASELEGGNCVVTHVNEKLNASFTGSKIHYVVFRNDCCTHEFQPVTRGLQILLTFNIYESDDYIDRMETIRLNLSSSLNKPLSIKHRYTDFTRNIERFLTHYPVLGFFATENYFENGFTASSLIGTDKQLYESLLTKGIVISLAYVVCTPLNHNALDGFICHDSDDEFIHSSNVSGGVVRLLDSKSLLLTEHQNINSNCYFISEKAKVPHVSVDKKNNGKTNQVRIAFIMSKAK